MLPLLAVLAGTGLGLACRAPAAALLGLAAAALAMAALALLRRARRAPDSAAADDARLGPGELSLLAGMLFIAWAAAGLRAFDPDPRHLAQCLQRERESVELRALITDDPAAQPGRSPGSIFWTFTVEAKAMRRLEGWQDARGSVRVTLLRPGNERRPQYGDTWELAGVLTDRARFPVPASGSRPPWRWRGSRLAMAADSDAARLLESGGGNPFMAACFAGRARCARSLETGLENAPGTAGLLKALLLGYRQELPSKTREAFVVTGTYHVFAISGQHVMILAFLAIFLLQTYGVSRVRWILYLAPLIAVFTLATGMSASAVRGCIMALAAFAGPFLHRRPDMPSAMALAAIVILLCDPLQLVNRGFILSFAAVAGLIVITPPLSRALARRLAVEPFVPPARPPWQARLARACALYLGQLLAAGWAAWLAVAPLCAAWFNLVSPIGMLANLLVVPAITAVMIAGCAALLAGAIHPALSLPFNLLNRGLVSATTAALSGLADIPLGYFYVQAPTPLFIATWFCSIAAWRLLRGRSRLWLAGPALLALLLARGAWAERGRVTLTAAHLGESICLFVNAPGSQNDWLLDPGPRYSSRRLVRFLRTQGVNRLGAVLISRRKADCAGATLDLLEAVPAREIMLGLTDRDRSPTIKAIMAAMASNGIPVRTLSRPDSGVLPGKVTWRVLHPESSLDAGAADDQALALRLERGRAAVLIRTESSPCVSSNLLGASAAPLAAEILVLADSAPNADPQPDFLRAAAPHVLVNSASQRSPDGLPATSLRVAIGPMQSVEISLDPDSASLSQPVDME
ncbi:MAG: DUF4131 domain-containing protein [Lentisphaerae bacterium]|nr:DUF4131 domain-containing protein [Lentisphaerota bacterium]